jgi:hypothetical protein
MPRQTLLKPFRILHLYFGVFIAPALLFFALTGALQTFGLHETNRDHPNYTPAHWIVVLGQIHKKQTPIVPVKRAPEASKPVAKSPAPTPAPVASPPPAPAAHNPLPLRIFFLIVCIGLVTSTFTGLYMSYNYVRNKRLVSLTLAAGVVLPLVLLLF